MERAALRNYRRSGRTPGLVQRFTMLQNVRWTACESIRPFEYC